MILGNTHKREELAGDWRKMLTEKHLDLHSSIRRAQLLEKTNEHWTSDKNSENNTPLQNAYTRCLAVASYKKTQMMNKA